MVIKVSNDVLAGPYDWCIAGGYAACPSLASDQDVWIFGIAKDDLEDYREALLKMFPFINAEDNPERDSPEAYFGVCYTLKVGTLGNRHILVTSANTVEELIGGFDISTHQCAITSDGEFVKGYAWTPIWEPAKALIRGLKTDKRLVKLFTRYSFLWQLQGSL